ncbi:MAG TPA: transcriptional repressor [Sedimenticola thiotaurini]|uniref:Ferric uptake regulation protein n=1 Tax=Sedimenticola thiotaurini TaxID=1543721 RepID=A0A831W7A7_9GAMM|nr:transcriptional repressor [Sedimenticola thiotaurini]
MSGQGGSSIDQAACDAALVRAEQLCRSRGARLTVQRRRVLEILCRSRRPLGAYEILDRLQQDTAGARPTTVYRALAFLQEQGLVHRIESLNAFLGCLHPEHPHLGQFLICRRCGRVQELEDAGVERDLGRMARASGFQPDLRVVELLGRCSDCTGGRR